MSRLSASVSMLILGALAVRLSADPPGSASTGAASPGGAGSALGLPPSAKDGAYAKPSAAELRKRLSPLQFEVTQNEGTEPPFENAYWNDHRAGIFVDIVSGEPLFSSSDKYDSGTGWPSFVRPMVPDNIVTHSDTSYGMLRVEARSRWAGSHLGHVFDDGPAPTGLRYCMNSASLRFVPKEKMAAEGYGDYLKYVK